MLVEHCFSANFQGAQTFEPKKIVVLYACAAKNETIKHAKFILKC